MFEKAKFMQKVDIVLRSWDMPVQDLQLVDQLALTIIIHIMDCREHASILKSNYVCADAAILSAIYVCTKAECEKDYDTLVKGLLKRIFMSCNKLFHISLNDIDQMFQNRFETFDDLLLSGDSLESISGEASFLFSCDIAHNKYIEFSNKTPLPLMDYEKQFIIHSETKLLLKSLNRVICNLFTSEPSAAQTTAKNQANTDKPIQNEPVPFHLSPLCARLDDRYLERMALEWGVSLDIAKKLIDYERMQKGLPPLYGEPPQKTEPSVPKASNNGKISTPPSKSPKKKRKSAIVTSLICITIALVFLGLLWSRSSTPSASDKPSASESTPSATKPALPQNQSASNTKRTYTPVAAKDGEMLITPSYEQLCPFKVVVSYSDQQNVDFFIFLEYLCPFPDGKSADGVISYVQRGGRYSSYYDTRTQSSYQAWRAKEYPTIPLTDDIGAFLSTSTVLSFDVPPGCYRLWYCSGETWYGMTHYFGDDTVWYTSNEILTFYLDDTFAHGQEITLKPTVNGNLDTYIADAEDLPPALQ